MVAEDVLIGTLRATTMLAVGVVHHKYIHQLAGLPSCEILRGVEARMRLNKM